MLPQEFLAALFADAPSEDRSIVLFSGRVCHWHASVESAAAQATELGERADCYFGLSLQSREAALAEALRRRGKAVPLLHVRGFATTVQAIGGFWLDVDWRTEHHRQGNLPEDRERALEIIDALPAKPTIVLNTGGGLHAHWLFNEPWILEDDDARLRAMRLSAGWQWLAREYARRRVWHVDATHDLTRVLRVAGTRNHKYNVEVLLDPSSNPGTRYEPDDFEIWCPADIEVQSLDTGIAVSIGDLDLDPNAEPPATKLLALIDLNTDFARTWERRRDREFSSQSEYDMALASQLARSAWSDQEIANALIAHRRAGGGAMKHALYYKRTLSRARMGAGQSEALVIAQERIVERALGHDVDSQEAPPAPADVPGMATPTRQVSGDPRAGVLHDVSTLLGVRILGIQKLSGDVATYRLVVENGETTLGSVSAITNATRFRDALASATGHLIQRMKSAAWDPVASSLLAAVEELDTGAQGSLRGEITEILGSYISERHIAENAEMGLRGRMPFSAQGRVFVRLRDLSMWMRGDGEPIDRRALAQRLRAVGCEPRRITVMNEATGRPTSVNAWRVPGSLLDGGESNPPPSVEPPSPTPAPQPAPQQEPANVA